MAGVRGSLQSHRNFFHFWKLVCYDDVLAQQAGKQQRALPPGTPPYNVAGVHAERCLNLVHGGVQHALPIDGQDSVVGLDLLGAVGQSTGNHRRHTCTMARGRGRNLETKGHGLFLDQAHAADIGSTVARGCSRGCRVDVLWGEEVAAALNLQSSV